MTSLPPSSAGPPPAPESETDPSPLDVASAAADTDLPPWPVWTAPASVAVGFVVGTLGALVVELIGGAGGSSVKHPTPAVSLIADVAFDLGFVAAALYLSSYRSRARPADFGFRAVGIGQAAKVMALGALAYYGVTTIYASVFKLHGSDKLPTEFNASHSTAALVGAAIFVCVVAPIAEEFFFRGFFFGALRKWRIMIGGRNIGVWVAAVVTGLLFGLAHTGSASSQYLIPLGFLGFVLCMVRWRTRSLYPCIALHSANNALALGVNQLSWNAPEIVGLVLLSWAVVGALTLPLMSRSPRLA